MGRAIGIDLGTTYSSAACTEAGRPTVIPSAEGGNLVPSMVAIGKNGELLVGESAKRQAILNPENTIFSIKRLIGRKFSDPTIQYTMRRTPYRITEAPNGDCRVIMGGKEYTPQEISAMILQKLAADAEDHLGEVLTDAVITVPAYFNDCQRNATRDAGTIAGLNVMRIINEPTAAALAYGLNGKEDRTVAIYDLGGGSFDISILDMGEGTFQVKSTNGDTHLGGDDIDERIVDWLCDGFKKETGVDLKRDPIALQRLREAAEKAKRELSAVQRTDVDLPFIAADAEGGRHLSMILTRPKVEELCRDLIERSLDRCRQAVKDAGLEVKHINDVILVGDQTRMPLVQEIVLKFFGRVSRKGINIDEAVAVGAAIEAGVLKGEVREVLLMDVIPLTLGIETLGGVATPLIPRNTTIPTSASQIFSTTSDGQQSVEVRVLQGERPMAADNQTLGRFVLDGLLPAPRGKAQIEVTFDIDPNGILNVRARDKVTGREQRVTIEASGGLSKDDVQRMRKDAERYAAQAAKRHRDAEVRNT